MQDPWPSFETVFGPANDTHQVTGHKINEDGTIGDLVIRSVTNQVAAGKLSPVESAQQERTLPRTSPRKKDEPLGGAPALVAENKRAIAMQAWPPKETQYTKSVLRMPDGRACNDYCPDPTAFAEPEPPRFAQRVRVPLQVVPRGDPREPAAPLQEVPSNWLNTEASSG